MKLYGLQKLTLLDYPGHTACTVFFGGCDLRCPFCHNYELAELVAAPLPDFGPEDFFQFLEKRKGLLDGVALSGGEPLLQEDLPDFLERIHEKGFLTKLDTNGMHPKSLEQVLRLGLVDYVAMDIKNSPGKYAVTIGSNPANFDQTGLDRMYESISLIRGMAPDYEFRTTVVKEFHSAEDFTAIGILIQGAKRYALQPFVLRETVPNQQLHAPEPEELLLYQEILSPFVAEILVRG